ncbi:hypothetical protein [Paraburkholderia sp. J11-2]|nr:hypothetical protein [Paraburkholderia sp. J11-2]
MIAVKILGAWLALTMLAAWLLTALIRGASEPVEEISVQQERQS